MSYTSNVTYSGMGNQNSQRLKDIQKAESTANENAKELIEKNREKVVSSDLWKLESKRKRLSMNLDKQIYATKI